MPIKIPPREFDVIDCNVKDDEFRFRGTMAQCIDYMAGEQNGHLAARCNITGYIYNLNECYMVKEIDTLNHKVFRLQRLVERLMPMALPELSDLSPDAELARKELYALTTSPTETPHGPAGGS